MYEQTTETVVRNWVQQQRKAELVLNHDPNEATVQVLAALAADFPLPAAAFRMLADKNRALADSPDVEIHEALTRQVMLLEALMLHFAGKAATAKRPDHAAVLVKASLNCQKALNTALATVHTLAETKRDRVAIEVES